MEPVKSHLQQDYNRMTIADHLALRTQVSLKCGAKLVALNNYELYTMFQELFCCMLLNMFTESGILLIEIKHWSFYTISNQVRFAERHTNNREFVKYLLSLETHCLSSITSLLTNNRLF